MRSLRLLAIPVICYLSSAGLCLAEDKAYVDVGDAFAEGKQLWLENCETCHAYGTAGAPIPMRVSHWESRVLKDKQTLYSHAINGFFGPDDTQMPARGGNEKLTDQEVRLAVDYMVALARAYINKP